MTMTSLGDSSIDTAAAHICPQCSKSFSRLCDLNKHAKSHSRPYKCNDPTCKYNTLGWPTAKELERHYNDKHSAAPRTFPCMFQPCSYWSKRESNCKQHMEKAHNWKYVRSKSKGKRSAAQHSTAGSGSSPNERAMTADVDLDTSAASSSPHSSLMAHPGDVDFTLYGDDDQTGAIGETDGYLFTGYGEIQNLSSYLPWTSPVTRLRKNEAVIETFSQAYKSTPGDTSPVLSNYSLHGIQHYPQTDDLCHFADDAAIKVESPALTPDTAFSRKRKYEPVEAPLAEQMQATGLASGAAPPRSQNTRAGQGVSTPSTARDMSKPRDSGDDGCPPRKKPKPSPTEDFTDTSMPDIFRHAHPHIYDRSRADRYSPCHTVHREISTLVRHLSRPAHRLNVTERAISSFDVQDSDFSHPRAGVCRICWQTFDHRPAFEVHISRLCQKVSKGKREKWRVLFESFTPLCDTTDAAFSDIDTAAEQIEGPWETIPAHRDDSLVPSGNYALDEPGTPPTSVPSPADFQFAELGFLSSGVGHSVSAGDHDKLQRDYEALREKHQQLERMTQALLIQRLFQESMAHTTAAGREPKPSAPALSNSVRPNTWPVMSDRDSLFQHMDSQSTDVDVHGFMKEMEATRQTLSRNDSGMSTVSRSTIHHVPPGSPSQSAELELPPFVKSGGSARPQAEHSPAHRPPLPSIPDSGYGTEQRRGSLGDLPLGTGQHVATEQLTPPAAIEADKPISEGLTWLGDSPLQPALPASNTLSPRHNQTGFFTENEMAEYDDSFSLFYQDNNILQSRASPLGFTFDFSSQME